VVVNTTVEVVVNTTVEVVVKTIVEVVLNTIVQLAIKFPRSLFTVLYATSSEIFFPLLNEVTTVFPVLFKTDWARCHKWTI
jgi:hypothetical protein